MRTVKEISERTGISVRTLHYYDEIGLLKPTAYQENGYRLYDDKALETLQQILFYKEFDMPLKDIRDLMENSGFDRNMVLSSQKKLLECRKDRLSRLIESIDDILKGENKMDFTVFSKKEMEELYSMMIGNMNESQIKAIEKQYGDLKQYEEQFLKNAEDIHVQENMKKVVSWYGSKEKALDAAKQPAAAEVLEGYQNRISEIYAKLAERIGTDVNTFEIKALVEEYDFVSKQLYQMEDVTRLMRELAESYCKDEVVKKAVDEQYGPGASEYIGNAVLAF